MTCQYFFTPTSAAENGISLSAAKAEFVPRAHPGSGRHRAFLELLLPARVYSMLLGTVFVESEDMRKNLRLAGLFALFSAVAIWFAVAATPPVTLHVGDPAPKIQVGKWIQGQPVKEFEKDKIYIVEFWATWCVTCKTTIPHLNELQNKYKDKGVIVIGQSIGEEDDDDVPRFVKQMGDKMKYRVAIDDKSEGPVGKMDKEWMNAVGRNSLPTAFIIKQGKVAWIGSGTALDEKLIDEILSDKYDLAKAAEEYNKNVARQQKYDEVFEKFQQASAEKQWPKAQELLTEVEKYTLPNEESDVAIVRLKLYLRMQDFAAAEKALKRAAELQPEDATHHGALAWMVATYAPEAKNLVAIAEKEAEKANELAKGKSADLLDTLARVQFVKGDKDAAVATMQKAVELAEEKEKKPFQKTLAAYKAGKLPEDE
jgi:thiol-disulfide isomerase/thioredoxin